MVVKDGASTVHKDVVAETAKVTGLPPTHIEVVTICRSCEEGVTIVLELRGGHAEEGAAAGAGGAGGAAVKCPVAGLNGLLAYHDIKESYTPLATRIDFSDPDPTKNVTGNATTEKE
jgi:hypothetical protein